MGSNRGRKAGGGSKDFSEGLKYSSRREVNEVRGPGSGEPGLGVHSQDSRAPAPARGSRFRLSSALRPVGGPGSGAQVEFPVRWVPGRWLQGGAGRTSAPDLPRTGHRGSGKPQGLEASGSYSCLPPSRWLEKRTSVVVPFVLGYSALSR